MWFGSGKSKTVKRREREKQQNANIDQFIGKESFRTKRHKIGGKTSKNDSHNTFISVGHIKDIHIPALKQVYGADNNGNELCEASLCSITGGDKRMLVCDCGGKKSHWLPEQTGPHDKANWAKVVSLSKKAAGKK